MNVELSNEEPSGESWARNKSEPGNVSPFSISVGPPPKVLSYDPTIGKFGEAVIPKIYNSLLELQIILSGSSLELPPINVE